MHTNFHCHILPILLLTEKCIYLLCTVHLIKHTERLKMDEDQIQILPSQDDAKTH